MTGEKMKRPLLFCVAALAAALVASQFKAPVYAAQNEPSRGAVLYKQRCAACHAIAGKGGKVGPDLTAILGRKAGSAKFAYSPTMKASRTIWTKPNLDKFLAAPAKIIPGTRMTIAVSNAQDREAIVNYLATGK